MSKTLLRVVVIATALVSVLPRAAFAASVDLSVSSISGSPDPITLGTGNVQYTVYLYNGSTSQGTNPVLTSTLPANSTFVSATTPYAGGTCTQAGGTATCNWASIPPGNSYYAITTATPTSKSALTLSSSVSGTEPDPNPANNSASRAVTVNSQIDLSVSSISGSLFSITIRPPPRYTLVPNTTRIRSQGTNPVLTSTLPANSTFVSATTPYAGGTCTQSGGTATCNWASIAAGNSQHPGIGVGPKGGRGRAPPFKKKGTEPEPNPGNHNDNKAVTV